MQERARRILAAVNGAAEDCRRAARGVTGRLSIGFAGSTTYAVLPVVANALRESLPAIERELHGEMLTPAQIHWLTDGALDMGLLRPPVRERSLNVDVVCAEPSVLALPSGHRFADAAEVPLGAR